MNPRAPAVTLERIRPQDEPFLFQVYAGTRAQELAPLGWSKEATTAFLQQQFYAQHQYYQTYFADADFLLILLENQPVGRLYIVRRADGIRIIDIALLPEYRNAGIGSHLLRELLAEATVSGKPVRLHVEKRNPALGLYERLGFYVIEDKQVYWYMEWTPPPASQIQKGE